MCNTENRHLRCFSVVLLWRQLQKREVVVCDESGGGSSISLTLWGEQAKTFTALHRVLAIRGTTVISIKEYEVWPIRIRKDPYLFLSIRIHINLKTDLITKGSVPVYIFYTVNIYFHV